MELLTAPQNLPFAIALGFVGALALLQVVALLLGGPIGMGDGDFDADIDLDTDADLDLDADGGFAGALDWLGVGKLPLSILLTLWAAGFGLSGLAIQEFALSAHRRALADVVAFAVGFGIIISDSQNQRRDFAAHYSA